MRFFGTFKNSLFRKNTAFGEKVGYKVGYFLLFLLFTLCILCNNSFYLCSLCVLLSSFTSCIIKSQ